MKNQDFKIELEKSDDKETHLEIRGVINTLTAPVFERKLNVALNDILAEEKESLLLDMGLVSFLSSMGIRAILTIYKKAKEAGVGFYIKHPSENVQNVLGMVALDDLLLK